MSRAVSYRHADWLSLVEPTGSFLTLPVLNRVFPEGIDRTDVSDRHQVRERYTSDGADRAERTAWIEWVLGDLLSWGSRLASGPGVPATLTHVVGEHNVVLRPDYVLLEPAEGGDQVRALVCLWPAGTKLDSKVDGERWSATPAERMAQLCQATNVGLGIVTDGNQWRLVWSPKEGSPGGATFLASLFTEEAAVLDAFTSLLSAKRFFAVAPKDQIEALLVESVSAQEVVAGQLGRQVRSAAEMLIASFSRANLDRNGVVLEGLDGIEIYSGTVTVLMRLVFLLFAEERGLLPLDDEVYAASYAVSTMRAQLQAEQDLHGDEPLERKSTAWFRCLALFRAVHGGITHESLRIPPYGGRLFDPDRFPFLEGRRSGQHWKQDPSSPIPVDDLTMLAVLTSLQVLEFNEGGVKEARQLSYRTLEVEQIGHVYEGLLDHSVRRVDDIVLGLVGKPGDEPEVLLEEVEEAAAGSRAELLKWLVKTTGRTEKFLAKCLDTPPGETDRQLLGAAVDNDEVLVVRILPFIHLLVRDLRELPKVLLPGAHYATLTSSRREGGVEYTTKDLADEVARYALEPLVYSPGPQDGSDESSWRLRSSAEILNLKICDPAVGSGAILVAAGRYLASRLVEAWDVEGADETLGDADEVMVNARRAIADRCLYGVDRDPLATEMAKLSLWLTTMSKNRPFSFLDHAIRTGDSLLGVTDLEQIRWMHLDPAEGRRLHQSLFDFTGQLEPLVADALDRRRQLEELSVITIRDAEEKARLLDEADEDLSLLRVIADLVIGAALSTSTKTKSVLDGRLVGIAHEMSTAMEAALHTSQRQLLLMQLQRVADEWLNTDRPNTAPVRHCLHWPLEFPEVFMGNERSGFDALIGNPPFIGGQKITPAVGENYRLHLVASVAGGRRGSADLVAYFFLRARALAHSLGFLATNTIAQGETSEVGLLQMIESGWKVYRAVSSIPWPGRAALEIAQVWATLEPWSENVWLDGQFAPGIDEMLYPVSRSNWRKRRLTANRDRAFQGATILGLGFTMTPDDATELIHRNSKNRDVLFPYLGGEDLNNSPSQTASRWTINFFDWNEDRAREYPDCFDIVEEKVKPERQKHLEKRYSISQRRGNLWWLFSADSAGLNRATLGLKRILALTRVSNTVLPVFVPSGQVLSEGTVVFAYEDDFHFGVLSSVFHYRWALRYSSTLGVGIRYTPSDVFDTFPQPSDTSAIRDAAKILNEVRGTVMLEQGMGLTATYGRVHDPNDLTLPILRLRGAHVAVDLAVRDSYGWGDINLGHGFHQVRGQGIRYTLSPAAAVEVLDRLLELNKERYEAEVAAGLHGSAKGPAKAKKAAPAVNAPSLFGDDAMDDGEASQ